MLSLLPTPASKTIRCPLPTSAPPSEWRIQLWRRPSLRRISEGMIDVLFRTDYPPNFGLDGDTLAFLLWDGYECRTAAEAHDWILELLRLGETVTILDDRGEPWEFWCETVRAVGTWER